MNSKIEQVIAENTQSSQIVIHGKSGHQQGAIAPGLLKNAASHMRVKKELRYIGKVFNIWVLYDYMNIIILEKTLKRIGVGQEGQKNDEE